MTGESGRAAWTLRQRGLLLALFGIGIAVRAVLVVQPGFLDDMDQFAQWIGHIATSGLGQLYTDTPGGRVTFGPVMGYIWGVLGAIQPAFATAVDATDPAVNALMKVPAPLADVGIAALVVVALRATPWWAIVGAAAVLLHPAVIDVSAWWGQYESIYVLPALGAVIAASRGRNGLAAALLAVSLATKPQAIPFILPFVAWCWASGGWREVLRCAAVGAGTLVVLWLPFVAAGGPVRYLENLALYQNEVFNVLSLRAWNPWSLVQEAATGGQFVADDVSIVGPITLRWIGYAITGVLSLLIMAWIVRDPRPRTLILGMTASVLIFFLAMTQMHERYSYAALIFPILLLAEARVRWWWLALSAVVTVNLLAAIPPTPGIAGLLPPTGLLAVVGAVVMTALGAWVMRELHRSSDAANTAPAASP